MGLFASKCCVFVWHGETSNPDEKSKTMYQSSTLSRIMVRVRRLISKRLPWPSLSSDVLDPLFRKFPSPCWTTAMYFCWILVGKCTCGWENLATRVKNLLECLWQIVT